MVNDLSISELMKLCNMYLKNRNEWKSQCFHAIMFFQIKKSTNFRFFFFFFFRVILICDFTLVLAIFFTLLYIYAYVVVIIARIYIVLIDKNSFSVCHLHRSIYFGFNGSKPLKHCKRKRKIHSTLNREKRL